MDIAIGRRRLVVNLIVDQKGSISSRFPSASEATDRELASLEAKRQAKLDRNRMAVNATLYGVGLPR